MGDCLEIKVKYLGVGDYHLFTAASPLVKGLCAGSADLKTAFEEVSHQIAYLMKKNYDQDCECVAAISFDDFAEFVAGIGRNTSNGVKVVPSAVIDYKRSEQIAA